MDNERLSEAIVQIHGASKAIYGEPKIRAELRDDSVAEHDVAFSHVGKHRVARLMRARGLQGVCKRRSYTVTTERNKKARPAHQFNSQNSQKSHRNCVLSVSYRRVISQLNADATRLVALLHGRLDTERVDLGFVVDRDCSAWEAANACLERSACLRAITARTLSLCGRASLALRTATASPCNEFAADACIAAS